MSRTLRLRLVGGAIFLFNLWLVGRFNIEGPAVGVITIGFVVAYEYFVVRPANKEPHKAIPLTDQQPKEERQIAASGETTNEANQVAESPLPSIGGVALVFCVMIGIVALLLLVASSSS